jgi:hypothetical protein
VQVPCVQIDAGMESVLPVVEAHHGHGLSGVGAGLIPLLCWEVRWLSLDPLYHIWDGLSPIPARP